MKLVLIHGRAQEGKDSIALKAAWVKALADRLTSLGLSLPIAEADIKFPYYGDTLYDLSSGADETTEVIVRGEGGDGPDPLSQEILAEIVERTMERAKERGLTSEAELQAAMGGDVIERGILNWRLVQKGLEWLDEKVPGASAASIALATRDVHDYLRNPGIQHMIESGVREAIPSGEESIVVSHSLGTVVAYNLLRREGEARGWKVPLFVTLGSPLAVKGIRKAMAPLQFPAVVSEWYNAMDEDDVVALYSLEQPRFPIPGIENHTGVDNQTSNQHGISGYLGDPEVAKRIRQALG